MKKRFSLIVALLPCLSFFAAAQTNTGTNQPSEIVITPYKTTMIADGKDVALVKISVIDKQGNPVTNANNLVRFGSGKNRS